MKYYKVKVVWPCGFIAYNCVASQTSSTLVGVSSHLLSRQQSVMNTAARLIFSSSKFQHITPLLCQLHWLKAPERIAFKYAVLMYKCLHGCEPAYLTDKLCQVADVEARQRLRHWLSAAPDCLPSFSGCNCSHLEQSAWPCHFCTFRICLNISYPSPLWLYSARAVMLSCSNAS